MAETYFNSQTGKLIIGKAAIEAENYATSMGDYDFENSPTDDTGALLNIPELLNGASLPPGIGSRPDQRPRTSQWDAESVTQLGRWLLGQIQAGGGSSIKEVHFERLNVLNIGPSAPLVRRLIPGGISRLRADIDDTGGRKMRSGAPDWSVQRWQRFAVSVKRSLTDQRRAPTMEDYLAVGNLTDGPSRWHIRNFGIKKLNELAGHPNVPDYTDDELIDLGARIIIANPHLDRPLGQYGIEALSNRASGPSSSLLVKRFGSRSRYQQLAREHARTLLLEQASHRQQRLSRYEQIINETERLESLPTNMTDDQKVAFAARYDVAYRISGPEREGNAWTAAAYTRIGDFTERLRANNPGLTNGSIEVQAETLGVFDDLWPPDTSLNSLYIPQQEYDTVRAKYEAARQRWRRLAAS